MEDVSFGASSWIDMPNSNLNRKRALKACLACRSRKVRCDVSLVSQPCTNCRHLGKTCLVVGRATRLATRGGRHNRRVPIEASEKQNSQPTAVETGSESQNRTEEPASDGPSNDTVCPENLFGLSQSSDPFIVQPDHASSDTGQESPRSSNPPTSHNGSQAPSASMVVTYSHCRFLSISNLHSISASDVNYLESQGCLHVPMRPVLDDFVEQYFLHVHPMVPMIDEGNFWDMYAQNHTEKAERSLDTVSLVLFQAMLFSSCTFVPFDCIRKLGYATLRQTRAEFYRRAKLLYELHAESNHLPLAQASILLMLWYPPLHMALVPCQTWLSRAVQHARYLDADGLAARPDASIKGQESLRRLWWCCIIADRIMSLSARCRPLISHSTFDFRCSTALQASDLQDEVYRSSVYNPASKKSLNCLLEVSTNFMLMLTDVLEITFPLRNLSVAKQDIDIEESVKILECESALNQWFSHASAIFPPFEQPNSAMEKRPSLHKSVSLHVGILYIYYYHSKIALQHCKLSSYLRSATDQVGEPTALLTIRDNLQDAVSSMSQLFSSLNRLRLVRWLPVSAIGCMAIPLALSVVTAKLETANATSMPTHSLGASSDSHSLIVFTEALSCFYPQYDDVEMIKAAVRQAADKVETMSQAYSPWTPNLSWTEILLNDPSSYLRIVLMIDICINKGRVADDQDLPEWLLSRDKVKSPDVFLDTLNETILEGFSPTLGGLLLSQIADLGE